MSIKTKIAALALSALAVTGSIASTTTQAEAKGLHGWGIGAGLVGAAIVGSAIAASNDGYYYDGYRRCGCVRQFDAYGKHNYYNRAASREPAITDDRLKSDRGSCVRHGRLIHPVPYPTRPVVPPGGSTFSKVMSRGVARTSLGDANRWCRPRSLL